MNSEDPDQPVKKSSTAEASVCMLERVNVSNGHIACTVPNLHMVLTAIICAGTPTWRTRMIQIALCGGTV